MAARRGKGYQVARDTGNDLAHSLGDIVLSIKDERELAQCRRLIESGPRSAPGVSKITAVCASALKITASLLLDEVWRREHGIPRPPLTPAVMAHLEHKAVDGSTI